MHSIFSKLILILLAFLTVASIQAQERKNYYVAYEMIGEDVYNNHSKWIFEFYSSALVVISGNARNQYNFYNSDSTGNWYKKTTSFNNPLISAREETIWVSNDKEVMIWQENGLFQIFRILCSSLEKAKRKAQESGYE